MWMSYHREFGDVNIQSVIQREKLWISCYGACNFGYPVCHTECGNVEILYVIVWRCGLPVCHGVWRCEYPVIECGDGVILSGMA